MKTSHLRMALLATFFGPALVSFAAETGATSPEDLIRTIYTDHQPWTKKQIDFHNRATLQKYFSDEITDMFLEMYALQAKTNELCMLDADPILNAQAYDDDLELDLKIRPSSDQPNVYEAWFKIMNSMPVPGHRMNYQVEKIGNQWRVVDIVYFGASSYSLKEMLRGSKQMCLESIKATK